MRHTATYSPDDNKLRLYPAGRLPREEYDRLKGAGFTWAAKQELFVAPAWTPEREDLLLEMCGEIDDEDKSLVQRAEERAERFDGYSESRAEEAEQAHKAVRSIADNIPLGQPILVGHHSERHARKDAERIENGMRRAVKAWETAQFWKARAAGAIHAAKYKERPDVRARRIKTIEADKRKRERTKATLEVCLQFWSGTLPKKSGGFFSVNRDTALWFTNVVDHGGCKLSDGSAYWSTWGALNDEKLTVEDLKAQRLESLPVSIAHVDRWIAHYNNRLEYEKSMLAADGGTVADKTRPEVGGACRCWAGPNGGWAFIQKVNKVTVTILDNWGNGGGNFTRTIPFDKLKGVMTAAEVAAAREAGRLIPTDDGTGLFLAGDGGEEIPKKQEPATEAAKFSALKDTLKAGVQVAVVENLFPTPGELARSVVQLAEIRDGDRVLEPSAGTGSLASEVARNTKGTLLCVEINPQLAEGLTRMGYTVQRADFLTCNGDLGTFDRIVMNPPFDHGADIKHIKHALTMLRTGGRLVALCANGPRQQEELAGLGEWRELPEGSFAEQGTRVNVAMLVVDK